MIGARLFSRTDQSFVGRWWWTIDRIMLGAFIVLMVCGVVLVASASPPVAERIGLNQYHFIKRHLILLGPSLLLMIGVSMFDPRTIWRISSLALISGFFAMILVLFIGMEIKGAQRWIHLPGFSLQPSEFMKPVFAIAAAWLMAREKENSSFPGNRIAVGVFALIVLLLLLQPDFGMTAVVTVIFGAQIFIAGFPLWLVIILGILAIAGAVGAYFVLDHVKSRIDRFLDPSAGDNYQVSQALEAFREGGVFGTGPGQGVVKLRIPDAHADFIFAVAGNEMGLFLAGFIVILFAFIILRGLNRVMDSSDMFIVLAGSGLLVMLGLQALIHMGANIQMLPAKGMTLPFVSYGGSSLLATAFTAGAILALTRRSARQTIAKSSRTVKNKTIDRKM